MSQDELSMLIELAVWSNSHQSSWGGSWAGSWASHTITCLLQDILDGRLLVVRDSVARLRDSVKFKRV